MSCSLCVSFFYAHCISCEWTTFLFSFVGLGGWIPKLSLRTFHSIILLKKCDTIVYFSIQVFYSHSIVYVDIIPDTELSQISRKKFFSFMPTRNGRARRREITQKIHQHRIISWPLSIHIFQRTSLSQLLDKIYLLINLHNNAIKNLFYRHSISSSGNHLRLN